MMTLKVKLRAALGFMSSKETDKSGEALVAVNELRLGTVSYPVLR
jgi:hypothetical protein